MGIMKIEIENGKRKMLTANGGVSQENLQQCCDAHFDGKSIEPV